MPTQELTDEARYDYGQELMALRVKKGVSVEEVAAAISRSTSSIYMAQTGKQYCEPIQEAMREYLDGLPDGDGEPEAQEQDPGRIKPPKLPMRRSWRRRTRAEIEAGVPKHSAAPKREVFINGELVNDRIPMPRQPTPEAKRFHDQVYSRSRAQIEDEAEVADQEDEESAFDSETLRLSHAYRATQKASQAALDALVAHLDS